MSLLDQGVAGCSIMLTVVIVNVWCRRTVNHLPFRQFNGTNWRVVTGSKLSSRDTICALLHSPRVGGWHTFVADARMPNSDKHDILLVDDEPSVRESMAEFLNEAGYEVSTAEHGFDALLTGNILACAMLLLRLKEGRQFRQSKVVPLNESPPR